VARLQDVYLFTLDDLGHIVTVAAESRLAAVAQAEPIIESRVRAFEAWLNGRATVPLIRDLRTRADELRKRELERARRLLARGAPSESVLEQFSRALTNKFLHPPISMLNDAASAPDEERRKQIEVLARFYRPHGA